MIKRFFILTIILIEFFSLAANADDITKNDVIMIANGDYDVFIETSEEEFRPYLKELDIEIGGTKIVEDAYLESLISKFTPIKTSFGGSAANSAYILSSLGKNNGLYVVLSDEKISQDFISNLENVGVKNYGEVMPREARGDNSVMTKVAAFITNAKTAQSERTFVAYKGLCADFSHVKFDLSHIKNYKILYIEGYVFSPKSRDIIFDAIKEAKKHNVQILFSPSNPVFVEIYKDDFKQIIDSSDIVFTNHGELKILYPDIKTDEAIKEISQKVNIAIVTNGSNGSVISSEKGMNIAKINEHIDQSKVIDTTGAGDAYLAGFLYGYLNNCDMYQSGRIGALTANHIIQEIGARPSKNIMDKIHNKLHNLKCGDVKSY